MNSYHAQNRNDVRFASRNPVSLDARLLFLKDEEVVPVACLLSDISVGGCAVRAKLPANVSVGMAVLQLKNAYGDLLLEIAGRLCWTQQTSVGATTYGFRFRTPLDSGVIDRMVHQGMVTRRQDERIHVAEPVQLRRAHGKEPIQTAVLEDYSAAGLRLTVDRQVDMNERLLVTIPGGESGSIQVVWVASTELDIQCGCVFQNLNSARTINDSLARLATRA